ncbi:single-stranded DNA-binding protein [Apilactobacillus micheneri]|uniref:single-stranded DNA-binding protein n=1 Tax=Apilactobacillus micheneri TaxID=1899430 RepID=UPI001128BA32|nr:single-stranded DNA-binding protein [Apilactobacillus micheneri]TPR49241.1 single-stranded DNA-binding protein [Apilactobacillus micheneri]
MMNITGLVGRTTRDIESNDKQTAAHFDLAVQRNHKERDGSYKADFFRVNFFSNVKYISENVRKGSLITVTGRLANDNYTNSNGQKVHNVVVLANNIGFLSLKNGNNQNSSGQSNNSNANLSRNNQNNNKQDNGEIAHDDFNPFYNDGDNIDVSDDDLPF